MELIFHNIDNQCLANVKRINNKCVVEKYAI